MTPIQGFERCQQMLTPWVTNGHETFSARYLPIHIKSPFAQAVFRVFTYFWPPLGVPQWCVRTELVSIQTTYGALQQAFFNQLNAPRLANILFCLYITKSLKWKQHAVAKHLRRRTTVFLPAPGKLE